MEVSAEGWPVWHGRHTSMCQFRDNILLATNATPGDRDSVGQAVRQVLKACWDLEVDCDCITKNVRICKGSRCNSVT